MTRRVQLGEYEVDFETGELRKDGNSLKLQDQPLRVLAALLDRPGEVVTRGALKEVLWPDHTSVDFDHGLGTAVGKLRAALGDSAKEPRYIETIPRRGFRLVAPAKELPGADGPTPSTRRWSIPVTLVAALVLVAVSVSVLSKREAADARAFESVAVLPLEDISGGVNDAYWADGMTDALIHTLAQIPTLGVISRTSVLGYEDTSQPIPQIAEELGVDAIVEGTVHRSQGRIEVAVRLIDARRDRLVWSETFTGKASDVLSVQNEVARATARRMPVSLSPELDARMSRAAQVSPRAHESYLKGLHLVDRGDMRGSEAAIRHFHEALRLEPDFALAHAGLARAYGRLRYQRGTDRSFLEKSKSAALLAIAIDPYLAQAHAALGYALEHEYEWVAAERAFQRAIELAPNSAESRGLYANFLMKSARWDEALEQAQTAKTLDPLSPSRIVFLGVALGHVGHFDESLLMFREALELYPDLYLAHLGYGINAFLDGDVDRAIPSLESAARHSRGQPHTLAWLAKAYAATGREDAVREIDRSLREGSRRGELVASVRAIVAKELGDVEEAYQLLEQAYAVDDPLISELNLLLFGSFHDEPRFEALKRRIGLL